MRFKTIAASLAGVLAFGLAASAQVPAETQPKAHVQAPAAPVTPTPAPGLSKQDVDGWLDGFMPYALSSGDIAGAVVVVVKDGQVLTEKGYGYADVKSGRKVDPKTTLFRAGSVGKLFTWTAVMQQVEAGKLDLDRDVNAYLDFKIPPRDGKPVTLRNLMTHTPGFEEHVRALVVPAPGDLKPIGDYLKAWVPLRIFPPGEVPAYSNYGATLAGYIVQRVSGEAYDDYVERHILAPLQMSRSTFRQPLPAAWRGELSAGYDRASQPPHAFELFSVVPAGSLTATGDDMAKFMLAHLQGGRLLQPATTDQMFRYSGRLSPPIDGMALGFYHEDRNGRRVVGHAGDTQYFHSDLHLMPDEHVGLFVSLNSTGKAGAAGAVRTALYRGLVDPEIPPPPPHLPTPTTPNAPSPRFHGP
jgi:CubicO group peptidase (beta-lactamase class C family)